MAVECWHTLTASMSRGGVLIRVIVVTHTFKNDAHAVVVLLWFMLAVVSGGKGRLWNGHNVFCGEGTGGGAKLKIRLPPL